MALLILSTKEMMTALTALTALRDLFHRRNMHMRTAQTLAAHL